MDCKAQALVDRMERIGIRNPDEYTYAYALATLIIIHFTIFPKYKQIYSFLNELQQAFRSSLTVWPDGKIVQYPEDPGQLPEDAFRHAYPDEQPVAQSLPRLKNVAKNHIPLRKNSDLLRDELGKEKNRS